MWNICIMYFSLYIEQIFIALTFKKKFGLAMFCYDIFWIYNINPLKYVENKYSWQNFESIWYTVLAP